MSAVLRPEGANASPDWSPIAQPRQVLGQRLARLSLEAISKAIGKEDLSSVSKVRSNERACTLTEFCNLLEAAGLKLVAKEKFCVSREEFEFMRRTTARAIANEHIANALFSEPE